MSRNRFQDLLQSPMDRKDFLKQLGIGAIMLTGASAVVTNLLNKGSITHTDASTSSATTYGASSYGTAQTHL